MLDWWVQCTHFSCKNTGLCLKTSISKPPDIAKGAQFYGVCTDSSVCMSNIFGVRWCEMIWLWMELGEGKICSVHSWNTYCAALSSSKRRPEAKVRRESRSLENFSQRAHLHKHPQEKSRWDVCVHHANFVFCLILEACKLFQ